MSVLNESGVRWVAMGKEFVWVAPEDFDAPRWDPGGVHDWRNHVPEQIQREWPALSAQARAVAVVMAQDAADREEWD